MISLRGFFSAHLTAVAVVVILGLTVLGVVTGFLPPIYPHDGYSVRQ